jgi:hypothetical protein
VDDDNAVPADLEALAFADERLWKDECAAVKLYTG